MLLAIKYTKSTYPCFQISTLACQSPKPAIIISSTDLIVICTAKFIDCKIFVCALSDMAFTKFEVVLTIKICQEYLVWIIPRFFSWNVIIVMRLKNTEF